MRIAIVSCGESAKTAYSRDIGDSYDVTIGVNWACYHWPFDWVAAWDALIWRYNSGLDAIWPSVGIATCGRLPDDVAKLAEARQLQVEAFPRRPLCSTTFPSALEWALAKWPDAAIDVYGVDMDTQQGLEPWHDAKAHSSYRWDREARHLMRIWSESGDRICLVGCAVDPSQFGA